MIKKDIRTLLKTGLRARRPNPTLRALLYCKSFSYIYISGAIFLALMIWVIDNIFRYDYPIKFSTFLRVPEISDILGAISQYWPFFATFLLLSFINQVSRLDRQKDSWKMKVARLLLVSSAEDLAKGELIKGNFASIFEELFYRFIGMSVAMRFLRLSDWIFGGIFFGTGIFSWGAIHILGPILNFISFGNFYTALSPFGNWLAFGAIIVSTNAFSGAHEYEGGPTPIIPYFSGLFLGLAAVQYGIVASIVLHSLYNNTVVLLNYYIRKKYFG